MCLLLQYVHTERAFIFSGESQKMLQGLQESDSQCLGKKKIELLCVPLTSRDDFLGGRGLCRYFPMAYCPPKDPDPVMLDL